jgi:hypothetical protein
MLSQTPIDRESGQPVSDERAVRAQLGRLLAHPLFTASKRYPAFLAYVVDETLRGNAAELKERTIGVGAFGRKPDYDANADPVVRMVASEVRKRLVQYYYDSAHHGELVVELSPGSYVPSFRDAEATSLVVAPQIDEELVSDAPTEAVVVRRAARRWPVWPRYAAVALLACLVGAGIGRYRPTPEPSNFDRFWAPFVSSVSPVTYCVAEPGAPPRPPRTQASQDAPIHLVGRLDVADVVTLARTIVPLVPRHGAFRVLPASETTFEQLREGPSVLIGALDNYWTLRVTEKIRYGFEFEKGVSRLVDRAGPTRVVWEVPPGSTYRDLGADYAIVARIHDKLTGQPVIVVGGILDRGTEAAGEVLYNPALIDAVLARAPKDWERLNVEAVIKTQLVEGRPGPPTIVAVEVW